MELLNRYIAEIGKRLPRKNRADIENEIHSTLEDMLADRSAQAGRPADEAMLKDLLREYGAPDKVAATYLPERYLIGPRLYPLFEMVVKIVFAVLTALAVVGAGIRFGMAPAAGMLGTAAETAGRAALEYLQSLIAAFGNIVLVFAVLERVLPESQINQMNPAMQGAWDPDQLMAEPTGDEVKLWEPVAGILFTAAALVLFNFYPQVIGVVINPKSLTFIPLLSDAFFRFLPWLNILWGLEIVLQLALFRAGRYTPATRWFSVALKAGGVALAGAMLAGPSLVGMTTAQLIAAGFDAAAAGALVTLFSTMMRVALIIAVAAGSLDVIRGAYRAMTRPGRPRPILSH